VCVDTTKAPAIVCVHVTQQCTLSCAKPSHQQAVAEQGVSLNDTHVSCMGAPVVHTGAAAGQCWAIPALLCQQTQASEGKAPSPAALSGHPCQLQVVQPCVAMHNGYKHGSHPTPFCLQVGCQLVVARHNTRGKTQPTNHLCNNSRTDRPRVAWQAEQWRQQWASPLPQPSALSLVPWESPGQTCSSGK
jgi:hypothetical protein